jgi:hypothetical protein
MSLSRGNHEKLTASWKLELHSFRFIKQFREREFLASDPGNQKAISKTITIQLGDMNEQKPSDFVMDIKSFHEINILGCG